MSSARTMTSLGGTVINTANVSVAKANVAAANGLVHVVNKVLMPRM